MDRNCKQGDTSTNRDNRYLKRGSDKQSDQRHFYRADATLSCQSGVERGGLISMIVRRERVPKPFDQRILRMFVFVVMLMIVIMIMFMFIMMSHNMFLARLVCRQN